jgi:hypothetical protein
MSTTVSSTTGPTATGPKPPRPARDVRRLRRYVAAVVLVVPAVCISINRLVSPTFAEDDTGKILDAVAAQPGRQVAGVLLGSAALMTLVPAFLAAARLARRRRPVLAMIAAGVNLIAYLGAGLSFAAMDNLTLVGGELPAGQRGAAAAVIDAFGASGIFTASTAAFIVGHVLGAVLMGFALRGSIPTLGWIAMAVSQPAHFVCFVILQNRVLDAAAWGLTALGFVFCAIAVLRIADDEWDLAPAPR